MKTRILTQARLALPVASAIALAGFALTASSAFAAPYFWDIDGDTAPGAGGATPGGSWAVGGTTWSTDSTGAAGTSAYTTLPADDLTFSAGTDATGSYTVTLGANQDANSLTFEDGAATLSGNTITLAGGGVTVAAGAGDATIGSALTASGSRVYDVGTGRTLFINGILTSTITKAGDGTMTLSGTPLHSLGAWTVNGGTLVLNSALQPVTNLEVIPGGTVNSGGTVKLAAGNRVANAAVFTINEGGVFDTNGQGDLIGRVIGAGSITNTGAATSNLQINPNGGTGTFSGVIGGGASAINFIVNGAGTQTLSGLNTYTGTTQVRQGSLSINTIGNVNGGPSAIGAPTSASNGIIAMGNGASTGTLVYTGTGHSTDRQVRIGTNGTTPAATNTGGGTITANGDGNAALVFNNSLFNAQTDASTGVGADRILTLQGISTGENTISGTIRDNLVSGTGTGTAKVGLTKAQAGTWVLSGTNTYTGTTTGTGGTLLLTKTAALPGYNVAGRVVFNGGTIGAIIGGVEGWTTGEVDTLLSSATKTSGTLGIDTRNGDLTQWTAFTAADFGALGLAKLGANTLTLNLANTYTGATIIRQGTLKLASGGLLNSGNYAGAVTFGGEAATFEHAGTGTQTLSGAVTGGGAVVLSANGQLILSNSGNTYGSLSLNNGRVFLNNNINALPAAATVSVTGGGNLVFGPAGARGNAITVGTGAGITARNGADLSNVALPGTGTVVFNNDDVNTGLLAISNGQTLTGSLTVQVGGTRMLATGGSIGRVDLSGNLTGGGALVMTSSGNVSNANYLTGVLTLSGTNDYAGTTTVNSGTLRINGNQSGATGAVTVGGASAAGTPTLAGTGTIGGNVTIDTAGGGAAGILAPGSDGIGNLILNGTTLSFGSGSTASFEVDADTTTNRDQVTGISALTYGGTLKITSTGTLSAGDSWDLFDFTSQSGTFDNNSSFGTDGSSDANLPDLGAGLVWQFNYTTGTLSVAASAGFSGWITGTFANGTVPSGKQGPNQDADNDGIPNLVEYAIAGQDPTVPNPTIGSFDGTLLSFTKRGDATGLTYAIEESTELGGIGDPWAEVVHNPPNIYVNNGTTISYTLTPGSPVRNFIRLMVLQTP